MNAQFLDGTTDVTRTWVCGTLFTSTYIIAEYNMFIDHFISFQHFGTPNEEEKRAFTRVLQGHIAIDQSVFPDKATGKIYIVFVRVRS